MNKCGIEYNLDVSPFRAKIEDYTLFFSSEFYMRKFNDELKEYENKLNVRFYTSLAYRVSIQPIAIAISLYYRIEKRGFLIYNESKDKFHRSIDSFNSALVLL